METSELAELREKLLEKREYHRVAGGPRTPPFPFPSPGLNLLEPVQLAPPGRLDRAAVMHALALVVGGLGFGFRVEMRALGSRSARTSTSPNPNP